MLPIISNRDCFIFSSDKSSLDNPYKIFFNKKNNTFIKSYFSLNKSFYPSSNEVFLYVFDMRKSISDLNENIEILSDEERLKALRYRNSFKKERFIAARSTLRRMFSNFLNLDPKEIDIYIEKEGRPLISNNDGLYFSISYCDSSFVIVVTRRYGTGVDIQKFSSKKNHAFNKIFNFEEKIKLKEELVWTRMEAIGKMNGQGLNAGLRNLYFMATDCKENFTNSRGCFFDFKISRRIYGSFFMR